MSIVDKISEEEFDLRVQCKQKIEGVIDAVQTNVSNGSIVVSGIRIGKHFLTAPAYFSQLDLAKGDKVSITTTLGSDIIELALNHNTGLAYKTRELPPYDGY